NSIFVPVLAVDPFSRFLFVAHEVESNTGLSVYDLSTTGTLLLRDEDFAKGVPLSMAVDPTGQLVYTVNGAMDLDIFRITRSGGVERIREFPLDAGEAPFLPSPLAIALDPTGQYLYVPSLTDDRSGRSILTPTRVTDPALPNGDILD